MNSRAILLGLSAVLLATRAGADLTTDLVGYFDFESGFGNQAAGATVDGTPVAGVVAVAPGGVVGNAMEFRSAGGTANEHLNLALDYGEGGTALGTSFTVSVWYSLDDAPAGSASDRYFVFEGQNDDDVSYGIRDLSQGDLGINDGQVYTHTADYGGGPDPNFAIVDAAVPGWHHVVQTYASDGTTTVITTYVDGAHVGTVSGATAFVASPALNVGAARDAAADRGFDGKMDELALWRRALTLSEVNEVFARGDQGLSLTDDLAGLGKAYVDVSPSDASAGIVTGQGIYDVGATVTITTSTEPGFVFGGWSGEFAGQPGSFTHTVVGGVVGVARFEPDSADDDGDGLTNYEEIVVYETIPTIADSDGDLLSDGDEVMRTGTDPNLDDSLAVDYILANLCTDGGGPDDVVLGTAGGGTVTLKLAARESEALQDPWSAVEPTAPGVTLGVAGDKLVLALPGTADPKRFFQVVGSAP